MFPIASLLMIGYALFGYLNPAAADGLKASKSLPCQSDEGLEYHTGGRIKPFICCLKTP